uniref:Chromosome 1 open reading frame 216 n=1 Tax=Varanus komodoensis TaxID=61221 RepID=A0A8D2J8L3_VARKO
MCQPELPLNPLFSEVKGNLQLDMTCLGGMDCQPDNNLNFMGEEPYDSNENWSQSMQGKLEQGGDNAGKEGEDIRRPPEGAEVSGVEHENASSEAGIKEGRKPASSPLEDNGYASSSLSIDSPDSGGTSAWDTPSGSETLFPALAEAFQNLQEKKAFKEWEKQKHHVHLVMYRRLALLRWIRSLQQKVVDQQNRLQDSFDTILDNRKELIRCVQQGMPSGSDPAGTE